MVCLCKFDTLILAANIEKSGCCVANDAAVSAARLSNSIVVTPGYAPWITFCDITTGSTYYAHYKGRRCC